MRRHISLAAITLALIAAGWSAAKAQPEKASFEIQVDMSGSGATVTCLGGCVIVLERGANPRTRPGKSLFFECKGAPGDPVRCSSGPIAGFLR